MNSKIRIIEYQESYAEKVAEMWNQSSEGWEGEVFNQTAESVRNSENASDFLKLYLALNEKDEVIGYCKLSLFDNDKDTWYIDLLNVRPDYYGKKIGKKLLLTAINYGIKEGIPRIDLHTWAGNLKAVPLYKKCGYFWENRDNSVHLVNLIPKVLKQELLQEFFPKIDWYKDNKRAIEIAPDGRKEGEFEYWQYNWEKDNEKLIVEFCRYGRGIRKIETNDLIISATAPDRKLIFGKPYKMKYEFVNKFGKEMLVDFFGKDDDMIKFDAKTSFTVKDKFIFEPKFFIDKIDDLIDEYKTQPVVRADIIINGKSITFENGISPQFPLFIDVKYDSYQYDDAENKIWFLIENVSKDAVTCTIELPSDDNFDFSNKKLQIHLKGKEKITLENSFTFAQPGIYKKPLKISLQESNFSYEQNVKIIAVTDYQNFFSESQNEYFSKRGKSFLVINKKNDKNSIFFGINDKDFGFYFPTPSLGKPFNNEFKFIEPKISYKKLIDRTYINVSFSSKKFSKANYIYHFNHFNNGKLDVQIELQRGEWEDNLFGLLSIWHPDNFLTLKKNGSLMSLDFPSIEDSSSIFSLENIQENWLFSKSEDLQHTFAMVWDDNLRYKNADWKNIFEFEMSKKEDQIIFGKISFFIDFFKNAYQVRKYKTKKDHLITLPEKPIDIYVNDANPFVSCIEDIKLKINANTTFSGEFLCKINDSESVKASFIYKKNTTIVFDNLPIFKSRDINHISVENVSKGLRREFQKFVFSKSKNEVTCKDEMIEGKKVKTIDNGQISFSASDEYAPCVFSMMVENQEVLDSLFPTPGPKSWWNPWQGGLAWSLSGMNLKSILKEEIKAEFISMKDNFLNEWKGIKITTAISNFEKYKGLNIHQYYLTLPDSKVVVRFFEVENTSGFRMHITMNYLNYFANPTANDVHFDCEMENGNLGVSGGGIEFSYNTKIGKFVLHNQKNNVYILPPIDNELMSLETDASLIGSEFHQKLVINSNEIKKSYPCFIILSDQNLDLNNVIDLRKIRF